MDQVTEEAAKKQHEHNHAIRGNLVEVGAMDVDHNVEEQNPNSDKFRKKREAEHQFVHMVMEIQEAYNSLMERLNQELETLREAIEQIEKEMEQNRLVWETEAEILDEIDDVFCNLNDGGQLDCEKAHEVILKAGYDVPENTTDAQLIALLQDIRKDKLEKLETLDADFLVLESSHTQFRAREEEVIKVKQKLQHIGNDHSLNDTQKLTAIENLRQDVGSKTLHAAATITQEKETTAKADKSIDNDWENQQSEQSVSVSNSLNGLSF